MGSSKSFTVDLADPQSLVSRLAEAEHELSRLEIDLQERFAEVSRWRQMVATMRNLAGAAENSSDAGVAPSHLTEMQGRVVAVVNREVRKIRAREVTDILQREGVAISNDSVSNCLWHVAEKVQPSPIQRVGRGFYAPLEYKEIELSQAETAGSVLAGVGLGAVAAGAAHSLLKAGGGS